MTRAHEKVRRHAAQPQGSADELFQGREALLQRHRRGLNLRINLCTRKAYGYRSFDLLKMFLYHTLGDLPEPMFTHKFS